MGQAKRRLTSCTRSATRQILDDYGKLAPVEERKGGSFDSLAICRKVHRTILSIDPVDGAEVVLFRRNLGSHYWDDYSHPQRLSLARCLSCIMFFFESFHLNLELNKANGHRRIRDDPKSRLWFLGA